MPRRIFQPFDGNEVLDALEFGVAGRNGRTFPACRLHGEAIGERKRILSLNPGGGDDIMEVVGRATDGKAGQDDIEETIGLFRPPLPGKDIVALADVYLVHAEVANPFPGCKASASQIFSQPGSPLR